MLRDLADLVPRLARHDLRIGEDLTGAPVGLDAHRSHMLVVGPPATGKTSLTVALLEQIVAAGRSACLIDPEGDHHALSELPRVVVMGRKGDHALPTPDELARLFGRPGESLVLDLSGLSRAGKVTYATKVLGPANAVRGARGLPHWTIVDEAHHIFPAEAAAASVCPSARPANLGRGLVVSQPQKRRVTEFAVARFFREAELRHQRGLDPGDATLARSVRER